MICTISEQVGMRLREARKAAGYRSARNFVAKYNIPESTFSQHETGRRSLNAEMIIYYSKLLNISPGWLLTGEGQAFIETELPSADLKSIPDTDIDYRQSTRPTLRAIEDRYAYVDMELFNMVLIELAPIFKDENISLSYEELIDFCIDIYNNVVNITADEKSVQAMIKLSVASLKRGASQPEIFQKTVDFT